MGISSAALNFIASTVKTENYSANEHVANSDCIQSFDFLIVARGAMYVFLKDRVPQAKFEKEFASEPSYSSSGNLSFEDEDSPGEEPENLIQIANQSVFMKVGNFVNKTMFKIPKKQRFENITDVNAPNFNKYAAPNFHGRKLLGIVAASNKTKVLRIPQEIYQYIIEPYSRHRLEFLQQHPFDEFIISRFPAIRNVPGVGPKKSLLSLPVLSLVPPKKIIKAD